VRRGDDRVGDRHKINLPNRPRGCSSRVVLATKDDGRPRARVVFYGQNTTRSLLWARTVMSGNTRNAFSDMG
jgi:hypothetical protein